MAYRLTYEFNMSWIGPGMGPSGGAPNISAAGGAGGNAQTLTLFSTAGGQNIVGSGTGGAIATADITALGNAMNTDVQAQLKAAGPLALMQGWVSGNP